MWIIRRGRLGDPGGAHPVKSPAAQSPDGEDVANDRFWLRWAKDAIEGAAEVRTGAAERLTRAVGWFWTVYTAVALVGTALLDQRYEAWVAILIAFPVGSLAVAYLLCVWVTFPKHVRFDPRVPALIKAAYREIDSARRRRMVVAATATALAAMSVVAAGLATALVPSLPSGEPALAVEPVGGEERFLSIAARVPGASSALVSVAGPAGSEETLPEVTVPTSDEIRLSVPTDGTTGQYSVSVSWDSEGSTHSISKVVKIEDDG